MGDTLPVVVIGAGGHAMVLINALKLLGTTVVGMTDMNETMRDQKILGIPVIGTDNELRHYPADSIRLVNGVGSVMDTASRKLIYERFKNLGYAFHTVIHPSSVIAEAVHLSEGVQVMAGTVIQPGTHIGGNSIVNTSVSVDHDCIIGKHVHIAPGVTVCGGVRIEDNVYIGSGAVIVQGVRIAPYIFIKAGTIVKRDVISREATEKEMQR